REARTLSTTNRPRHATNLQQHPKRVLEVTRAIQQRPNPRRASATLPRQAGLSASFSTDPLSPLDVFAAVESASGRASKNRPSSASSPSAPTAPAPQRRAKNEGSEPSEWGSSALTLFSTVRSIPTPI